MPLVPADVSAGSQRSVWWRCEKGHSWRAAVRSRTVGSGCPICAGKQLSLGENDLAALYPALAKQWDAEKNGRLTPRDVLPGAEKKVWWRCERGHSWRAAVSSRTRAGGGCPYCAGKQVLPGFNDLASQRPELAAQWDGEKNRALTPQQVTITSNRKVWWRCEKGHSYPAVIASRTNGSGCPYCTGKKVLAGFNDLATLEPKIVAEWHPTLNGALTPQMVSTGSRKRSGGNAPWATSGKLPSTPAPAQKNAAARSAQERRKRRGGKHGGIKTMPMFWALYRYFINLEESKLKKRFISLLLCFCMVLSFVPTAVWAADAEGSNTAIRYD